MFASTFQFMRHSLLFLTAMVPFVLNAQLTGPSLLPGDTVVQQVLSFFEIPNPEADGSTVWDGTQGDVLDEAMSVVFSAPLTPWGKSFAEADFGVESSGTMTYYDFDLAHTYYGGVQNGVEVVYDDPEVYMPLPFGSVLGEVWTDAFAATYAVGGDVYVRGGSVTATYQGTGTLNLPGGEAMSGIHCVDLAEMIVDTLPTGWVYTIEVNSRQLFDEVLFVPRLTMVSLTETLYDENGGILDAASSSFGLRISDYLMDVADVAAVSSFALYPNPAKAGEEIHAVWGGLERGPGAFLILDGVGREVWRERVWPGSRACNIRLPESLSAGTYFLTTDQGNVVKPFVIQP